MNTSLKSVLTHLADHAQSVRTWIYVIMPNCVDIVDNQVWLTAAKVAGNVVDFAKKSIDEVIMNQV